MKSYPVIIILTSFFLLVGCTTTKSPDLAETKGSFMPTPERLDDRYTNTVPGFLWNGIQYMRFSLNQKEKDQHKEAVYFALNNLPNGKIVSWYSQDRQVMGRVRVIHSYPKSTRVCRVYQAYIKVNTKSRHFMNNACSRLGSGWVFLK